MSAPPVVPPVADADRYYSTTLVVSTTQLGVPFPVYGSQEDLIVQVGGVVQPTTSWGFFSLSGMASLPITDGIINFAAPTSGFVEIIGNWQPRQTAMSTATGIGRREFNQTVGTIISGMREFARKFRYGTSAPLGFDGFGPLSQIPLSAATTIGFRYFVTDDSMGRPLLYVNLQSGWAGPFNFQGPQGATGATLGGTVTSIGTGYGLTGGPISSSGTAVLDATQFGWGLRNRLMNGAMAIDQVNNGSSVTLGAASGVTNYVTDGWYCYLGSAASGITGQQLSVKSGGVNFVLRVQRAAASTSTPSVNVAQVCETNDNIDLQGKWVTLSFKLRVGGSFLAANVSASVVTGTGSDQSAAGFAGLAWSGQVTAASLSLTPTPFFSTYSLQAQIPSTATQIGVLLNWTPTGTAGGADYLDLTDVQLEPGAVATAQVSYERMPLNADLLRCERQLEQSWDYGGGVTANVGGAATHVTENNTIYPSLEARFKREKRAVPTFSVFNPVTGSSGSFRNMTAGTDCAASVLYVGTKGAGFNSATSASVTQIVAGHWRADARL